MKFKRNNKIVGAPDITPMIDVVFLLLIFFMLSTTFIVQPGITINLPKSSAEEMKKEKEEIDISISREGDFYLEGKKVTLQALYELFTKAAATSKESIVIINADEMTSHGSVVSVMDSAKEAGITKLAVATESKK